MLRVTPIVSKLIKLSDKLYSKDWVDVTIVEQDSLLPMDMWADEDISYDTLINLDRCNKNKPYWILTTDDDIIRGIQKLPINKNGLVTTSIKIKRNLGMIISYRLTVEFMDTEDVYGDRMDANYLTNLVMKTVKTSTRDGLMYNKPIGVNYLTMLEQSDE